MAKLKQFIRDYGHLTVMTLCLVCCAVLLTSVAANRPLVAAADVHVPVLRARAAEGEQPEQAEPTATDTSSGFLLTEEYLEQQLESFLPESFPAGDIDADLEDQLLQLSFSMDRTALKTYLKARAGELGVAQNLVLQMLPRNLRAEGHFALSADDSGLHLQPVKLELGEKDFDLSGLPSGAFSAIDQGLNGLLQAAGARFSSLEITEEGLLLK